MIMKSLPVPLIFEKEIGNCIIRGQGLRIFASGESLEPDELLSNKMSNVEQGIINVEVWMLTFN